MLSVLAQFVQRGEATVVGAVALLAVAIAIVVVARHRAANRARRASGLRALSLKDAADLRAAGRDVIAAGDQDLAEAAELQRQMAWERQQAGREVARYGRGMTRAYCSTHDRWCLHPERGPHPPGGHDLEVAPEDWRPDAGPMDD